MICFITDHGTQFVAPDAIERMLELDSTHIYRCKVMLKSGQLYESHTPASSILAQIKQAQNLATSDHDEPNINSLQDRLIDAQQRLSETQQTLLDYLETMMAAKDRMIALGIPHGSFDDMFEQAMLRLQTQQSAQEPQQPVDPCPACQPGVICRTPLCGRGRMKMHSQPYNPNPTTIAPSGLSEGQHLVKVDGQWCVKHDNHVGVATTTPYGVSNTTTTPYGG